MKKLSKMSSTRQSVYRQIIYIFIHVNVKPIDSSLCPETNKYLRPTLEKITKRKCLFTARQTYIPEQSL